MDKSVRHCGAAIDAVIAEYPWSRYKRFVDIAGAYGSFLARLLKHVKAAEGVIFDQPQARTHRTSMPWRHAEHRGTADLLEIHDQLRAAFLPLSGLVGKGVGAGHRQQHVRSVLCSGMSPG